MIVDEESKLAKAKAAFKEDSQRFQTYLFQTKQDNERIEEQFKDAHRRKRELEDEESKLRARIEAVDAEIGTNEKHAELAEGHLAFTQNLIGEFRPRLAADPRKQLKPLSDEVVRLLREAERKADAVFMTQAGLDNPDAGALIENPEAEFGVSIHEQIPISKKDIHLFIKETVDENHFLIGVNNEIEEAYDKLVNSSSAEAVRLATQIAQTDGTLSVLSERLGALLKKIEMKE